MQPSLVSDGYDSSRWTGLSAFLQAAGEPGCYRRWKEQEQAPLQLQSQVQRQSVRA